MAGQCLFAVQRSRASGDDDARARVDALTAFYEPLGAAGARCDVVASTPHVLAGAIRFGATPAPEPGGVSWWLERPPRGSPPQTASCGPATRTCGRSAPACSPARTASAAAWSPAPAGPSASMRRRGPPGGAWSTHMVAAAVLAGLDPEVDATALPDLLALGFVAGERALLAGVRPVAPATRVDCGPDGVRGGHDLERRRPLGGAPGARGRRSGP